MIHFHLEIKVSTVVRRWWEELRRKKRKREKKVLLEKWEQVSRFFLHSRDHSAIIHICWQPWLTHMWKRFSFLSTSSSSRQLFESLKNVSDTVSFLVEVCISYHFLELVSFLLGSTPPCQAKPGWNSCQVVVAQQVYVVCTKNTSRLTTGATTLVVWPFFTTESSSYMLY